MDQNDSGARADRFAAYLADLTSVLGDARRHGPLTSYCTGLLMPADRKSVEPMAAMTAPERTAAQHQSMLHFVGQGDWSDAAVLSQVRARVVPAISAHGAVTAWIVDDTGFPKKGKHSVGVARQYCGQIGKQDNCQVALSLSIANAHASLPVAYRMYLPEAWTDDTERREKAGYPLETSGRHYSARNLSFPKINDPEAPPLRTERHVVTSIATLRRQLTVGLAHKLDRCPCCCRTAQRGKRMTQQD